MTDHTTEYAKKIVEGRKISGHSEYLACKRHLDDMAKKDFEYIFDSETAERHIKLANTLTIGEGKETPFKDTRFSRFYNWQFVWMEKKTFQYTQI